MQDQNYRRQNKAHFNDNETNKLSKFRKWIAVSPEPKQPGLSFTVLNYNILSQQLLEMHSYLYRDHSTQALRWNQRFFNLVGEIFHNNPDILCCQEVQKSHLFDIQARMRSLNYDVIYKKRTGDKPDGCAIFFKSHLFTLIEHHEIEFEQPGIELLDRENVAVVCKLALRNDPKIQFVVATTHLLYNPKRQDIRLAQVQILLAELDRIAKLPNAAEDAQSHLPIILSGDFNLQPHSAPYNLIVNGMLNYENLAQRTLSSSGKSTNNPANGRLLLPIKLGITDGCQHVNHEIKLYHSENNITSRIEHDIELTREIVNLFQTGVLRHNFDFKSAYQCPENFVSTYQNKWILVDYMFYTKGSKQNADKNNSSELQLLSYLALPSADECESVELRIPNNYLGSDHLSIAARFFLGRPSTTTTKL